MDVRSNDSSNDSNQALFWKFSSDYITTIQSGSGKDQIGFDASRSNSVYSGSTIRPKAISILVLLRL